MRSFEERVQFLMTLPLFRISGSGKRTREEAEAEIRREDLLASFITDTDASTWLRPDLQTWVPAEVDMAITSRMESGENIVVGWYQGGRLEEPVESLTKQEETDGMCYVEKELAATERLVKRFSTH